MSFNIQMLPVESDKVEKGPQQARTDPQKSKLPVKVGQPSSSQDFKIGDFVKVDVTNGKPSTLQLYIVGGPLPATLL